RSSASASNANAGAKPKSSKWFCNPLDVKRFSAAALVLDLGVAELKSLVEAFARVVELGAVNVWQALRVDEQLHAVAVELLVLRVHRVGKLELVREPGAARCAHASELDAIAEPQP